MKVFLVRVVRVMGVLWWVSGWLVVRVRSNGLWYRVCRCSWGCWCSIGRCSRLRFRCFLVRLVSCCLEDCWVSFRWMLFCVVR